MIDIEKLEEEFLAGLESSPIPVERMLEMIRMLREDNDVVRVLEWRSLMEEALNEQKDADALLRLSLETADMDVDNPQRKKDVGDMLDRVFKLCRKGEFVKTAGFDTDLPLGECLSHVDLLNKLEPGLLCVDSGWGFGVIKNVDTFYRKVIIDFNDNPSHAVSFGHVVEAVRLLDEKHIFAVHYRDPESFAELVKSSPGEVVKMALGSLGPLTVVMLKEALEQVGINEAGWKAFWPKARQELKSDPLVEVPVKRSELIILHESADKGRSDWISRLDAIRDPSEFSDFIEEIVAAVGKDNIDPEMQGAASSRFDQMLDISKHMPSDISARLIVAISRFGMELTDDAVQRCRHIAVASELPFILESLTSRQAQVFLDKAEAASSGEIICELTKSLLDMGWGAFNEALRFINKHNAGGRLRHFIAEHIHNGTETPQMLYRVALTFEDERWSEFVSARELLMRLIGAISSVSVSGAGRDEKRYKSLFEDDKWIAAVFGNLGDDARLDILMRLSQLVTWDAVERRSVVARVVRQFPELKTEMEQKHKKDDNLEADRFTSWRSYNERREKLKRLIEEEIPDNSREIAVARSYGDLRENHEYKAAKEHQGILMRRKAEYERDLGIVKGAYFDHAQVDKVGQGVQVEVERPGGVIQVYSILGEWDRDEALGIVSSESLVAKSLIGLSPGEIVELPSLESHEEAQTFERCIVKRILPLPDDIKKWASGSK